MVYILLLLTFEIKLLIIRITNKKNLPVLTMNFYREKLLNAILYFVKNTNQKKMGLTKLLKLLYFFDFEYFKKYGVPPIGLIYKTFPRGPVPEDLYSELKGGIAPFDWNPYLLLSKKNFDDEDGYSILFKALKSPDEGCFSQKELELLKELCFVFKDATADQMTEVSHLKNAPWATTKKNKGEKQEIDYMLAIDDKSDINPEYAQECLDNLFGFMNMTKQYPSYQIG